jgi:hypothetical protein
MADTPARDYQRLAELARNRRHELALALSDSNARAGEISKGTWRRVEQGLEIRYTNYVRIDALLQWAPGSCIRVIEGGDPIPVDSIEGAPGTQKSPLPPEVVDSEVRDTVQLALIATAKGTTAEEIREMSERVVRDLRERGLI